MCVCLGGVHIDFMSLDVEGSELRVLQGIDFARTKIDYIVIENDKGAERKIQVRRFLNSHGYEMKVKLWNTDEIWGLQP